MTLDEYTQLVAFLGERFAEIDRRFEQIDGRLEQVDRRFEQIDGRFGQVHRGFEQVDRGLEQIREDLNGFRRETLAHFDAIYQRLERLEQEYHAITQGLRRIEVLLADEKTRREILERSLEALKSRGPPGPHRRRRAAPRLVLTPEHGGGEVVVGVVGFVLGLPGDPDRVRAPDVAFVPEARLPDGRPPEGFFRGAPALAVEVLSPGDDPVQTHQKVRDYLDAGTWLVWVVVPQARTATV